MITDHKSFVEIQDNVELLISMVEMAVGLPYKQEDHTTAMQFIDAQLEKINSQAVFAREQDRLEMIRVLHAARVEADNGKNLDMEILLNLIDGIFKPEDEAAGDETSLQAALTVQVLRTNYENRGMATQERKAPKKNSDTLTRSPKQSVSDFSKLMQVVFDMKAEMGCMRKAMVNAGMSFDKSPNEPKPREHLVDGKLPGYLIPMMITNQNLEQWQSWQGPRSMKVPEP